jgi:RNA polymerase sigma-70 factor (ECF subfamily)
MTDRDQVLLARIAEGDRAAFNELMAAHQDRVFAVALRIMGNREEALDATQEAFLSVFRKASQYRGTAAVSTWLYRITVNACYDLLRRRRRRPSEPLPEHFDPADPSAGDAFLSVELRPDLEQALAQLSPEFRTAVVLSDVHALSWPEVAEVLDIPVGTVKSRVFRARRQLAALLGNQIPVEEHPRSDADA